MLDNDFIVQAADSLEKAEKSRTQIRQLTIQRPEITIEDGYAIQRQWMQRKIAAGSVVRGHKIGLTSRAMQVASNITEPDYGVLLDEMFFENGAEIPTARFIQPRIEVELAFILKAPLKGPGCTLFDVLRATEFVVPAIEIIDARIERVDAQTGATRKVQDTISDNAACAGILLGGKPSLPMEHDWRWVGAQLFRNAHIELTGIAAAVLNHPATGVAWLANRLAPHGVGLEEGQVVLGGSFTSPLEARQDDVFHADYGSLGSIAFSFV